MSTDPNPDNYSGMGYSPEYQRSGNETRADIVKAQNAETHFDRRGMGKTGLTRRPVSEAERLTICMLRGKGLSAIEIGEQLHRSAATVATVLSNAERLSKSLGLNYDWRADIKEKSIAAFRAGLVAEEDPYKRANLGLAGLKGLGEFENDGAKLNINALINAVPEAMRTRYVSLDPLPPKAITNGEAANGKPESA